MIKNVFQISFIFALVLLTKGEETKVNACQGNAILPKVLLYDEKSACKLPPCKVFPGSTLHLDVNFTSPGYLEHIEPKVTATIMGQDLPVDFLLPQHDVCSGITNTVCPLVKDESIIYTISLTLFKSLPSIGLGLEFYIVDNDTKETVVCFRVDLVVAN